MPHGCLLLSKAHLYVIAVAYFMVFDTTFYPLSFVLETMGLPKHMAWAINNGHIKPHAHILAPGAPNVLNHMPSLNQSSVTLFHKRIP